MISLVVQTKAGQLFAGYLMAFVGHREGLDGSCDSECQDRIPGMVLRVMVVVVKVVVVVVVVMGRLADAM